MKRVTEEVSKELTALCRKWRITRLSVFGSRSGISYSETSDLDLLVVFDDNVAWSLLDHCKMKRDFEELYGIPVDLLSQSALEGMQNLNRKTDISEQARLIYAA